MSTAARVKPEDYFTPVEWTQLSARSPWKGLALVAHCWLTIAVVLLCGARWPWTIPLGVLLVGNRQLGLFILMHDAAHGLLHPQRRINDTVGRWLCGYELGAYRPYHLTHHRFVQQSEDPDLVLSAPFPVTRASLHRKILRDVSGQTFFRQHFGALVARLKARAAGTSPWPLIAAEARRQRLFLLTNGVGFLTFALAGYGWLWCALWLLPMATWLPLVTRLRNIAEHALIVQNSTDPLRHARTTRANSIERLLIAPYWVNYHGEHHMFTQIACWNLPHAHRILARNGVTARMETQPGYVAMLRLAAPAPSTAPA